MPGRPGDKRAQFARVAARIREEVRDGWWRLGQRLPPEAELAARYGVSRGTVVRALDVLRAEGLVVTVHGQGSEIASVPEVAVVRLGPADSAVARMPEDHERDALGMPPGVPLIVVRRPGAGGPELYDGAVTVVRGAS
jgi:GntR family transcriptional regulator/MocR family aminotransferase